ncbi:MAG: hypothetical protein KatS3mg101_0938 [Patescibacteria group bacterium]|nr:MAG: hypothetical protein KatS3mg101_0938 [Patescibacteria group bacterium]
MGKNLTAKLPNTPKFKEWVRLYFDRNNKETFLNATQAAMRVYDATYESAQTIGWENLRKLERASAKILESMGMTFPELLKLGLKKVSEGTYSDWDKFMERLGYFDRQQEGTTVNVGVFNLVKDKYGEF